MGMNDTPSGERLHIGLFGRRNAGKSSLINALTGQEAALVSPEPGTTADPVAKAMEISSKAVTVAKENIWLCLIVKAGVLVASALGYAPMWLAVVADVGAAIAAVANSALNGR